MRRSAAVMVAALLPLLGSFSVADEPVADSSVIEDFDSPITRLRTFENARCEIFTGPKQHVENVAKLDCFPVVYVNGIASGGPKGWGSKGAFSSGGRGVVADPWWIKKMGGAERQQQEFGDHRGGQLRVRRVGLSDRGDGEECFRRGQSGEAL